MTAFPTLTLAQMPPWLLQHVPWLVFFFLFGSIVGSFINVVIYRLPAGMSVISPPSRCPVCGARLAWHENLPIIGWWIVRGRCRHCAAPISPQYMLIESFMAVLFTGLYAAYYLVRPSWSGGALAWSGGIAGEWWWRLGVWSTLPAFAMLLLMLAGLVAMTIVDARSFIIPIGIPRVVTILALLLWPLQAAWLTIFPGSTTAQAVTYRMWPIPVTGWPWLAASAGGMLGLAVSLVLLQRGLIKYSFADYDDYVAEGEVLGDYPHARREVARELLYLAPCLAGMLAGYAAGLRAGGTPPHLLQALGGAMLGYLVGGGIVWAVRILGTLGFGREAMGLGDVHLMGAVGAVLGWVDSVLIFMLAPFFGLAWAVLSMGVSSLLRRKRRELPFGPHLAAATLVVLWCRPWIAWVLATYCPYLQQPGFVP